MYYQEFITIITTYKVFVYSYYKHTFPHLSSLVLRLFSTAAAWNLVCVS